MSHERRKQHISIRHDIYHAVISANFACCCSEYIKQNFFFQSIIDNGISKKDVFAKKTIVVEDVKRTEKHRKEVAQKVITKGKNKPFKKELYYVNLPVDNWYNMCIYNWVKEDNKSIDVTEKIGFILDKISYYDESTINNPRGNEIFNCVVNLCGNTLVAN